MHMEYIEPTLTPVTIKVTFNDVEVLRKYFAVGETPVVDWNPPPKTSGVVQLYRIVGDEEKPWGSATYWGPDFKGAQALVLKAQKLQDEKKPWQARTLLMAAVKLFEKLAPDSSDLAGAYCSLWGISFFAKARPVNIQRRQQEALDWYEKEVALYERTGNLGELGGNLINLSVMYARFGDRVTALERALKGLAIIRAGDDTKDPEAIHAWTQTIWHLLALKKFAQAEKHIAEGFARFPNDPKRAYLFSAESQLLTARSERLKERAKALAERAKLCRQTAEALLPPGSCPLK